MPRMGERQPDRYAVGGEFAFIGDYSRLGSLRRGFGGEGGGLLFSSVTSLPVAFMRCENKDRLDRVGVERPDGLLVGCEQTNDLLGRAIANAEPNEFRWMAVEQAPLLKVGIFRCDREAIRACILPNVFVREAAKPAFPSVCAARKEGHQ